MKGKRGRPAIKPSVRKTIFEKAINRKQLPRLALAVELKNLIEEMGEVPPSEETMVKLISQARNRPVDSPLDNSWSLGCLTQYDIPSEALPIVMNIYNKCLVEDDEFTIREALWVGRLHKIIELYERGCMLPDVREAIISGRSPNSIKGEKIEFEDLVLDWAYKYASYERISEIEGESFDSSELDWYVMINIYEFYGDRRSDAISEIAEEYGADWDKLMALNLPIGKTKEAARSGKYQKEAHDERSHSQEVQE